ncbi:MAG TPA: hypothetical protein VFN67_40285 [Polyangiales bacterium]|jgi:hypothetical protein|nr:hypothetical protein [Polyangiales bacterium]
MSLHILGFAAMTGLSIFGTRVKYPTLVGRMLPSARLSAARAKTESGTRSPLLAACGTRAELPEHNAGALNPCKHFEDAP